MSHLNNLWLKITGGDKSKKYPEQQCSNTGRVGNKTILFPYGHYCNLPTDELVKAITTEVALPFTSDRPENERGEVIFFHPVTGAKIVFKNNNDIDVITPGNVNVTANAVNVNASAVTINAGNVLIDSPLATFTGKVVIDNGIEINGTSTSNGVDVSSSHIHTGDDGGTTSPPL